MSHRIALPALAAFLFFTACGGGETSAPPSSSSSGAPTGGTKIAPGFNLFRPEQDIEVGKQSAQQVESQLPLVQDAQVNAFVDRVGKRLASSAPGYQFPYEFHVIDASDLNAFALPGGIVFVNRGVLESARNEGEVAGVLAHEISHVALRHGTHQASRAYVAQAGAGLLGSIFGNHIGRGTAAMINMIGGFGLNALFLKYSRTAESEADVEGCQILARAGYDPADMISFFKTLERVDKRRTVAFLSDHPSPAMRIERIQKEASLLQAPPRVPAAGDTAQFHSVQAVLASMPPAKATEQLAQVGPPPGEPRQQGRIVIPAIAAPSAQMTAYASRDGLFRIGYPANWKLYDDGSSGATFAPEGGAGTIDGTSEIVYGAIASEYDPIGDAAAEKQVEGGVITLADATDDLIAQIRRSSPHLVAAERDQSVRLPSGDGLECVLRGDNPRTGLAERVTVVTHALAGQHLFFVIFVTPERDVAQYAPVWKAMLDSLRIGQP
jgi:beta-barrel assembly-enhancing protease